MGDLSTSAQSDDASGRPYLPEVELIRTVQRWLKESSAVWLATVVETYGSAPRPIGSMAAMNALGQVVGSVSGGCVEDDIVEWLQRDAMECVKGQLLVYGKDAEECNRLRLPCNGHIRVWLEPVPGALIDELASRLLAGKTACRQLDVATGRWALDLNGSLRTTKFSGTVLHQVLGPQYRAVLIGANEVSRYLAPILMTLGFAVAVIDPRQEYMSTWPHAGCELHLAMPDDVLSAAQPDERTAVIALSHDPKLDDLALMEALKVRCLYVGAMGSVRTTKARKQRLELFDVSADQLEALHGPVGAHIGARTPPEIAVAVAADLVSTLRLSQCASPVSARGKTLDPHQSS